MKHYVASCDGRTPAETADLISQPGAVFRAACGIVDYTAADGSHSTHWTTEPKSLDDIDCSVCLSIVIIKKVVKA